jgi:crotonobetainyl-CoA:carnitine CoA-transferase CaiB-like acyl-CoA transferase
LLALNPGPLDRPVVPPALIADIAGGTLPAVMNILLALRQRDKTGQGAHIDIAMTDAMFTFASHAIASGQAGGEFPGMGGARLTGGSPRYQIYPAKDGKLVCCAALSSGSGSRSRRRLGWRGNSSTTAAIRLRQKPRSLRSSPTRPRTNGARCSPKSIAA